MTRRLVVTLALGLATAIATPCFANDGPEAYEPKDLDDLVAGPDVFQDPDDLVVDTSDPDEMVVETTSLDEIDDAATEDPDSMVVDTHDLDDLTQPTYDLPDDPPRDRSTEQLTREKRLGSDSPEVEAARNELRTAMERYTRAETVYATMIRNDYPRGDARYEVIDERDRAKAELHSAQRHLDAKLDYAEHHND